MPLRGVGVVRLPSHQLSSKRYGLTAKHQSPLFVAIQPANCRSPRNYVRPNVIHSGVGLYTFRASPMCSFLLSRLTTSLSLLLISAYRDVFRSSCITRRTQSLVTLSIMACGALPISVSVGLMVVCWGHWGVVGHPTSCKPYCYRKGWSWKHYHREGDRML